MSEFVLKLPNREGGQDALTHLPVADVPIFLTHLLDLVWDVHDRGDLSQDEIRKLDGWIAHAIFSGKAELRQARRALHKRLAKEGLEIVT